MANWLSRLRSKLLPSFKIVRGDDRIFVTSRYFDFVFLPKNKFIQYGKNKDKYILILPCKDSKPPPIFSKKHWNVTRREGSILIGTTTKPLKIKQVIGDAHEEIWKRKRLGRQGIDIVQSDGVLR